MEIFGGEQRRRPRLSIVEGGLDVGKPFRPPQQLVGARQEGGGPVRIAPGQFELGPLFEDLSDQTGQTLITPNGSKQEYSSPDQSIPVSTSPRRPATSPEMTVWRPGALGWGPQRFQLAGMTRGEVE